MKMMMKMMTKMMMIINTAENKIMILNFLHIKSCIIMLFFYGFVDLLSRAHARLTR